MAASAYSSPSSFRPSLVEATARLRRGLLGTGRAARTALRCPPDSSPGTLATGTIFRPYFHLW